MVGNGLGLEMTLTTMFKNVNLAEGLSRTPMSFPTQGILATLPDTGIGHDDDVVSVVSRHETEDSHAHRAASGVAGVPVADHENWFLR